MEKQKKNLWLKVIVGVLVAAMIWGAIFNSIKSSETGQRWAENLSWLFNHPPTTITHGDAPPCDYCGRTDNLWHYKEICCICNYCRKQVFDSVLRSHGDELEIPGKEAD